MIERAVRLSDERISTDDLIPTLRGLMSRYSLDQQKRYVTSLTETLFFPFFLKQLAIVCLLISVPMLNYRVFEAHVVLKSFKNKMIDKFDSVELLHSLHAQAEERDLIRCGAGLCFRRAITVKGSHCKYLPTL